MTDLKRIREMPQILETTVLHRPKPRHVRFSDWTGNRAIPNVGTNAGATALPFQSWRPFKEAFAPEIVDRAMSETRGRVEHVVDPFGGSGTTALATQFLGARPTTIEVNPFLADMIESKVAPINCDRVAKEFADVVHQATICQEPRNPVFVGAPKTFVEPGHNGRYIFPRSIARRLLVYRSAICKIRDTAIRRLFRVILASTAIPVSNVVVSGKGRRYRGGWQERIVDARLVDQLFREGVLRALYELRKFASRACLEYRVLRGDARILLDEVEQHDLAVFSPPYPNSFDYTDVYNVELWTLGYLNGKDANTRLRQATLRSHVQIFRAHETGDLPSKALERTVQELGDVRQALWNRHIPEMVGAYAWDMATILRKLATKIRNRGRVYMIVGDSCYSGVDVPVATILSEIAPPLGYSIENLEPCRSMRASPQQGGQHNLKETLVVLERI